MFEEVDAVDHQPKEKSEDSTVDTTTTITAAANPATASSTSVTAKASSGSMQSKSLQSKSVGIKVGKRVVSHNVIRASSSRAGPSSSGGVGSRGGGGGVVHSHVSGVLPSHPGPSTAHSSRAGPSRDATHSYTGTTGSVTQSYTGGGVGRTSLKGKGKMGQKPSSRTVKKSLKVPQKLKPPAQKPAPPTGAVRKKISIRTGGRVDITPMAGSETSERTEANTAAGEAVLGEVPSAEGDPALVSGRAGASSTIADAGVSGVGEVPSEKGPLSGKADTSSSITGAGVFGAGEGHSGIGKGPPLVVSGRADTPSTSTAAGGVSRVGRDSSRGEILPASNGGVEDDAPTTDSGISRRAGILSTGAELPSATDAGVFREKQAPWTRYKIGKLGFMSVSFCACVCAPIEKKTR